LAGSKAEVVKRSDAVGAAAVADDGADEDEDGEAVD
jgi:hypothetical protein